MSEVISSKIQEWRQKAADGTMSVEEMRDAIEAIRKERVAASETSGKSRAKSTAASKAKNTPVDTASLLDELGI